MYNVHMHGVYKHTLPICKYKPGLMVNKPSKNFKIMISASIKCKTTAVHKVDSPAKIDPRIAYYVIFTNSFFLPLETRYYLTFFL